MQGKFQRLHDRHGFLGPVSKCDQESERERERKDGEQRSTLEPRYIVSVWCCTCQVQRKPTAFMSFDMSMCARACIALLYALCKDPSLANVSLPLPLYLSSGALEQTLSPLRKKEAHSPPKCFSNRNRLLQTLNEFQSVWLARARPPLREVSGTPL